MLDPVGGVRDQARDQDSCRPKLHTLPHGVFVLVPRIGGFDQIALRAHPQHQIDQLVELDVEGVRAVPASPAQ